MRKRILFLFAVCAVSYAGVACAQDDSPSLGDVARQSRQQKQQKDAQAANEAKTPTGTTASAQAIDTAPVAAAKASRKVITNEELPEHTGPSAARTPGPQSPDGTLPQKSGDRGEGEHLKSQVRQMKSDIASLQSQIADLEQSVRYAGGNCVSGCVQWNENQQKKQEQAATLKQQLEQMQQSLEQTQEAARKQGYGSSVYDPD